MKEIQRGGNDSLYEFIRKVGDLSENMKISLLTHKIIALFIWHPIPSLVLTLNINFYFKPEEVVIIK